MLKPIAAYNDVDQIAACSGVETGTDLLFEIVCLTASTI